MAANPLEELTSRIAKARDLPDPGEYQLASDPMVRLTSLLRGDLPTNDNEPVRGAEPTMDLPEMTAIESILGREIYQLVSSRPLSAESRKNAIERTAMALQNPSHENIRSILAALISE